MKPIAHFFFTLVILNSSLVFAQSVPPLINYQGRLTDETGSPLTNGTYRLAFRLYTNTIPVANETLIWGREYDASLIGGVFNVVLGAAGGATVAEPTAVNDLTFAFTEPTRFLELKVVRDAANTTVNRTILPRQQLLSAPYALQSYQSDRAEVATTLAQQFADFLSPPGAVIAYMGTNSIPPEGWDFCWGQTVGRTDPKYARLFTVIGTHNGAGDGSSTFALPDLRGMFLRGVNGSRTGPYQDSDITARAINGAGGSQNAVGSVQLDQFKSHNHNNGNYNRLLTVTTGVNTANGTDSTSNEPDLKITGTINAAGGNETRPKNVYVQYLIKL